MCSKCNLWLHPTCAKVSEKPESFSFTCSGCAHSRVPDDDDDGSIKAEVRALSNSFNNFVKANQDFKKEVSTCVNEVKTDILACSKLINSVYSSTSTKIAELKTENDILHRRLNRGDIILSGMPAGLDDLISNVVSLCLFFGITINSKDVYQVCYMNNQKLILVKFDNVSIRDRIMKEYFKTRSLKLCDIMGGEVSSRVYLNDHYSPAASELNVFIFMSHSGAE
ncbi:hypothetical protein FF38_14551 [Lucilia cuprina]|uniref:Uncharacterized protein n=1 Tax=Lucilia cuprina TaxID=7375 RepID=A0A0L0CLV0_LUCCU|nr:hypothetical protein CVS40_11342 [Lucilia cuprina]KNC33241.1 hypothetical protein FF38_14551 [Lucilia cuprina]